MKRGTKTRTLLRSALAGLVVFLASCDNDKEQVAISSVVDVVGFFKPLESATPPKLKIMLIDNEGQRQAVEGSAVNDAEGDFNFKLNDSALSLELGSSLPENWSAMGQSAPNLESLEGQFGAASAGYARVEIVPESFQENEATFKYRQIIFPISRSLALRADKRLLLNNTDDSERFKLIKVGRRRVVVTDATGAPVSGAKVSIIPYQADNPAPTWVSPGVASSFSLTGSDGIADAFPIPVDGVEPKYQIAVLTPNNCLHVTPLRLFSASELSNETIQVRNCPGEKFNNEKPEIEISFPSQATIKKEIVNRKETQVAYINDDRLALDVSSLNKSLRGLEVFIYEGEKAEGKVVKQHLFTSFSSYIRFQVLQTFQNGITENGTMTIGVRPFYSAEDREKFGEAEFKYVTVRRFVGNPKIQAQYVKLASIVGAENVISGISGIPFVINDAPCNADQEIGILVGKLANNEADIRFFSCSSFPITVDNSNLIFDEKQRGSFETIKFFIRDTFGNVSSDEIDGSNQKQNVYIDYGAADLRTHPDLFNLTYGIVAKNNTSEGSNDNPYPLLKISPDITPATISTFSLRFKSPNDCALLIKDEKDGQSTDAKGHLIHSFLVAPTEDQAKNSRKWANCEVGVDLRRELISVPVDPSSPIKFWMKTRDLAGNESTSRMHEIPACTTDNSVTCWNP